MVVWWCDGVSVAAIAVKLCLVAAVVTDIALAVVVAGVVVAAVAIVVGSSSVDSKS